MCVCCLQTEKSKQSTRNSPPIQGKEASNPKYIYMIYIYTVSTLKRANSPTSFVLNRRGGTGAIK